jgi:gamma-glutamylcyclotransferase (GGCT)/AIG2-like uncharacterized protein YtfP
MKQGRLYAAYGSNLNLAQMGSRCPGARVVGQGVVKNKRLLFRGHNGWAVATVEPHQGGAVPILVWSITADDEAALDQYEGYPILYRKESIRVELCERVVTAMIYIMNGGYPLGRPADSYYESILAGYRAAGFDEAILQQAVNDSTKMG